MGIALGQITTIAGLEVLRPAWTELWHRAPASTPFQAPAWLIPWWRHIGRGELLALTAHEGERLVGLLPMYLLDEARETKLLLLGAGNTDYCDGLFEPERAGIVVPALLARLARIGIHWDACDLGPLPEGSLLLHAPPPRGCVAAHSRGVPCPVLPLPGDQAGLRHALPRRMRQNLSYYRRRAEKLGDVRFERATPGTLAGLLEAFFALHGSRWSGRGEAGVLADQAVRAFHEEAAAELLQAGLLRLYVLRIAGRIAAALYGLLAKRRFYYYLSGFDPEYGELSPGTLVIGHALEQAVREGAYAFDFLRGREKYKYNWGAVDQPTAIVHLTPAEHELSSCTLDHVRLSYT